MAVPENITGKVTKAQFLEHAVDINAKETPAGAQAKADAAKTAAEASARAAYAAVVVLTGAGIDPTGVANSRVAMQAKIDTLTAGGIAYLPEGDFRCDAPLALPSHVTLQGAGYTSRLFSTVDKSNLIVSIGATNPVVRNIRVVGTGKGSQPANLAGGSTPSVADMANTGCGIVFAGADGGLIEGCWVENHGGRWEDLVDYNGIAGIYLTWDCRNVTVQNNTVRDCRNGINEDNYYGATRGSRGNRILNNDVQLCVFGIAVDYGSAGRYSLIQGNYVSTNDRMGIESNNSPYVTIADNQCDNNGKASGGFVGSGINVVATSAIPIARQIIRGNTCRNNGLHGIKVADYVNEFTVDGNICNSNTRIGVFVAGSSRDGSVRGNICMDNSLEGVGLYEGIRITDSTHIVVSGNRAGNPVIGSATNRQSYGLATTGTADYVTVGADNDFLDNLTAPALMVGGNNVFADSGRSLARTIYSPGTVQAPGNSTTTLADVDTTNLAVTFLAPLSGRVEVGLEAMCDIGTVSNVASWGLRTAAGADIAGSVRGMTRNNNASRCRAVIEVGGLTPGASYTYRWAIKSNAAGVLARLLVDTITYGPAVMDVRAG